MSNFLSAIKHSRVSHSHLLGRADRTKTSGFTSNPYLCGLKNTVDVTMTYLVEKNPWMNNDVASSRDLRWLTLSRFVLKLQTRRQRLYLSRCCYHCIRKESTLLFTLFVVGLNRAFYWFLHLVLNCLKYAVPYGSFWSLVGNDDGSIHKCLHTGTSRWGRPYCTSSACLDLCNTTTDGLDSH